MAAALRPGQVFVTGHSLGAAVETLTGLGLQLQALE